MSVNNDVWSKGPPQYRKQQGRLLNRRELQGPFVSHGIKLARSISFSVTQRHNGLLVKPNTLSVGVFFLTHTYIFHKSQKNTDNFYHITIKHLIIKVSRNKVFD